MIGLSIGGAYLAGGMARAAVVHSHMARLADVASEGFSEAALNATQGEDAGALAIARRHDPLINVDFNAREQQFAAALSARRGQPGSTNPLLIRASLGSEAPLASPTPAAPPPIA